MNGHAEEDVSASCEHAFDQFVTAVTCKTILSTFNHLLDATELRHANHAHFYEKLKAKLTGSWKAQNLWAKLDKRASHRDYKNGQACSNIRVLVIGSGPCGLRTAIECALLGAKTVIVEKRDRFSRNNVLHLWPFLITDLRNLGAKKFFGKFCAGAIDHISIRQLQCILLKVALLLGVEVHVNVTFEGLIEPPEDQSSDVGWKCKVTPENHAVSEYEFDVLIGADGKRNTLSGFKRKEFRGKLAIAVTANFINRNSQAEARVEEISGVAFIFNQKFFTDLKEKTRIDLENIVYYKDDTHYFVMTAKKASLLEKGVLKEDYSDTVTLLDRSNVDQERLMAFAREAADFSTNYKLPNLDYAVNHYGQADVAMFDFTSMFAAENASRFVLKNGHHLLMALVGDSLLEPFWPTGSGCARGFLSAFDSAWMIRSWAIGKTPLQVLAERESIYTVLSQTTPNYLNKNHNLFSIDPNTRYPNLNVKVVKPSQVRHFYEGGMFDNKELEEEDLAVTVPAKRPRNADISGIDSYSLLRWCQRVLNTGKYRDVHVVDFTSSWRSGLALCALIHSFRPNIINNTMLMECDVATNNQLAFSVAEKELGIQPVLTGADMAEYEVPDKLTMVSYLAQFYDLFKHEPLPSSMPLTVKAKRKSTSKDVANQPKPPHSPNRRISLFQKLSAKLSKSKKRKEQEENERSILGSKRLKEKEEKEDVELTRYNKLPMDEIANRLQLDRKTDIKVNKTEEMSGAVSVTAMADILVAKFKSHESKPPPEPIKRLRTQPTLLAATAASEFCSFCHKRVYIMERMSAEGEFFHRGCLKCDYCGVGLRLPHYFCDRDTKPVKFYCYRHAIPEQRTRPQRKRVLEEDVKENVPDVVVTPPPEVDTGQGSKEKSPRKAPSTPLTPLLLPKNHLETADNTPERVEFEISFDGEEESEEEQFEHNLRASLSSDTLLDDDDDSDSELSDLDMESGAEDEVWENAVESLNSSHTPLTLEEAYELQGNWRRQHSHENLLDAVEKDRTSRGPEYSRLLGENGEEEGSSTEVEEDSEYETDDSSAEEDTDEDKTEPAQEASTDNYTEMPLKSPSSVSRLSASKASFFSEPPKVVSLDPWSMFGMGKNTVEKEMDVTENVAKEVKVRRKKSSASDKKKSSASESRSVSERKPSSDSKKDISSKDTDISESLELEFKSADMSAGKGELMSPAGSLDELKEDFSMDVIEDVKGELHSQGTESIEVATADMPQNSIPIKKKLHVDDLDKKEEKGSERDDEVVEDPSEVLGNTAMSQAVEQLLHKSLCKSLTSGSDSSDSEADELFLEGRISPSAHRMRKHLVKHRTKRKRHQICHSISSDSENGRTEPTSTETSQPHSDASRSSSVELVDDVLHDDGTSNKLQNDVISVQNNLKSGSGDEKLVEISNRDLDKLLNSGTDGDDESFQQVLENVAAMPDLSDNSDIDDLVFKNIDDKFVTDRRRRPLKKSSSKLQKNLKQKSGKEGISDVNRGEDTSMNNSFSISTPSESESTVSSLEIDELAGQVLEIEPGDDDIKPDKDMLEDYTTTLSLALGDSFSDEMEEKILGEEKSVDTQNNVSTSNEKPLPQAVHEDICSNNNRSEQRDVTEEPEKTADNSSLYITPDASLEMQDKSVAYITDSPTSSSCPLPAPRSKVPVPQPRKCSARLSATKETISDSNQAALSALAPFHNRDSSGSDIYLTPIESNSELPFVNTPSTSNSSQASILSQPSEAITVTSQSEISVLSKDSSENTKLSSGSAKLPMNSANTVLNSVASRMHQKVPDLPKLIITTKELTDDVILDQPIMCSSPKLGSKLTPRTFISHSNHHNQALPVPNNTSKAHTHKLSSKTSVATSESSSSANKNKEFTNKIAFSPQSKTKIPIDKSKFKLGSCSDQPESDHDMGTKKKISAEGIVINHTFDEDIPFADESEAEEKFYTPCAPESKGKPLFPSSDQLDGRKKMPITPILDVTSERQTTHVNKSKIQAGERASSKTDKIHSASNTTASVVKRLSSEKSVDSHAKRSTSCDTSSTDRDDCRVLTATSSATEGDQKSPTMSRKSKKNKVKTHKSKKEQKDKKKSVLNLILPTKALTKGSNNNSSAGQSSDSTPKESDGISKTKTADKLTTVNKSNEKTTKTVKTKSDSCEDFDKTPTSESKRELAICSVFHSEASNRQSKDLLGVRPAKRTISLATKASVDEMSDSDESHISLSTMQRRRDEDLDERVARRLRKIQQKQQKRAEQKRLRVAQELQRQLEEVEVKQRELEERGIAVEKALRGDAPDSEDIDESQLMSEWFTLVHEKNALLRYESELNVRAKELELEDRQARLEMDYRERAKQPAKAHGAAPRHLKKQTKTESDIAAEGQLLDELLEVVEQRSNLVSMLEEDRLREQMEDNDLKEMMAQKGFVLSPLSFDTRRQKIEAPLATYAL